MEERRKRGRREEEREEIAWRREEREKKKCWRWERKEGEGGKTGWESVEREESGGSQDAEGGKRKREEEGFNVIKEGFRKGRRGSKKKTGEM